MLNSIDKVLSELELSFRGNDQEILCALGNICNSETPVKESFSRILQHRRRDSGSRVENVREFSSRAWIRLYDSFRNTKDNARE